MQLFTAYTSPSFIVIGSVSSQHQGRCCRLLIETAKSDAKRKTLALGAWGDGPRSKAGGLNAAAESDEDTLGRLATKEYRPANQHQPGGGAMAFSRLKHRLRQDP